MVLQDRFVFDTTLQQLVTRNYRVRGLPTASSGFSSTYEYNQQGVIERLSLTDETALGATGVHPVSQWLPAVVGQDVPMLAEAE